MGTWKALFTAIGIMSTVFLVALIVRPPKFDAIVKANPPGLYIPGFTISFVLGVFIIWRGSRK
jgi:hypothetical protein